MSTPRLEATPPVAPRLADGLSHHRYRGAGRLDRISHGRSVDHRAARPRRRDCGPSTTCARIVASSCAKESAGAETASCAAATTDWRYDLDGAVREITSQKRFRPSSSATATACALCASPRGSRWFSSTLLPTAGRSTSSSIRSRASSRRSRSASGCARSAARSRCRATGR